MLNCIEGEFPHTKCSSDKLQIQSNAEEDKTINSFWVMYTANTLSMFLLYVAKLKLNYII